MKLVIKLGGDLAKADFPPGLIGDIKKLSETKQLVLVHGGGDIVTEMATKLGKEQRFIVSPEGVRSRYTDRETIDIYTMVMCGMIAKKLVQILAKQGIRAVSLSGLDGAVLTASRKKKLMTVDDRGRKFIIDGGYTGKIQAANPEVIDALWSKKFVPVVSPVAMSEEAEPLNVDSDRAAAYLAMGVQADSVIFLTDVKGLMLGDKVVEKMTVSQAKGILRQIGHGMQVKVMAAVDAVEGGAKEAIICSGFGDTPIADALNHKGCTVLTR